MIAPVPVGQAAWPWLTNGDWSVVVVVGKSDKDDLR